MELPLGPRTVNAGQAVKAVSDFNSMTVDEQAAFEMGRTILVGEDLVWNGWPCRRFPKNMVFGKSVSMVLRDCEAFDNEVSGNADFSECSCLREIGPHARFHGNLNAAGTALAAFDSPVDGDADLSRNPSLKEIGPHAFFGRNLDVSESGLCRFFGTAMDGNACFDLRFTPDLATIGPSANLFSARLLMLGSPIEKTRPFLDDPMVARLKAAASSGRPEDAFVAAVAQCSVWFGRPGAPRIPDSVDDAVRTTARICGPVLISGSLGDVSGKTVFRPTGALYFGKVPVSDISEAECARQSALILPYYESASAYSLPSDRSLITQEILRLTAHLRGPGGI